LGVEVYFPILDASATEITVWRTADGVTEEVAGAKHATVAGDFVITDFGVPFGVVSSYTAEIFDAGGASVTGLPSTIQIDSDEVWFTNPIDPEQSFTVEMQAASLDMVSRGTNLSKVYVMGVPRPFAQFLGEGALEDIPLEIWSRTPTETQNMMSLTSTGVWLIRTPPIFVTLPRLLYVAVKSPRHKYLDLSKPDQPIVWVLTVDEVQPTSKAIIRPLITWDDWESAFSGFTWNQVLAIYSAGSWTDAVRNPPIA